MRQARCSEVIAIIWRYSALVKHFTCSWAPNPFKVRLAIAELGIPVENIEMNVRERENRKAPFLATNPNGRLPAIDDDGFLLWESNAILAYLGRKYREKEMWPATERGEADALRWLFYEMGTIQPPAADIWWARWLTPRLGGNVPASGKAEDAIKDMERPFNVLNEHFVKNEWVLGASFTLVDCAMAAPLMMLELSGVPLDRWRNVMSYWKRWKVRPSFAATPFAFPAESASG